MPWNECTQVGERMKNIALEIGRDYSAHPWASPFGLFISVEAVGGEGGIDENHPGFRASRVLRCAPYVQNRSRRFCRTLPQPTAAKGSKTDLCNR